MDKVKEMVKDLTERSMELKRIGTVELVFDRNIKIESIHKAVETAVRWHGCAPCGLNGLDLKFRIQDPAFEVFNDIEGLRDINVYR